MPSNDPQDSAVAEADRRVERAKASLLSRVDALKHKLGDAKHQLDLPSQIVRHPLPAIGIAFAIGAYAGLRGSRPAGPDVGGERSLTGAALAALAAFGLRLARELAIGQLGQAAKQWWNEQQSASSTEARASRTADIEPFLEH